VTACPHPAVVFARDDPDALVETLRPPEIVELMVRVEQQRRRSAAELRKSSSMCRKNNDTTEQYDFKQRSANRLQFARPAELSWSFGCSRFSNARATASCASMHGEKWTKFGIQGGCIKRTRTRIINITFYETYIQQN